MNCPVCAMTELRVAERQGVEIDYCPQCRGVWLDRGELDKIIARAMAEAPVSANSSRDDDRDERYDYRREHKPNRKKSFLGDLFDFD